MRCGDAVVLALAADHVVSDGEGFVAACRVARDAAERGHIVTFGVTPDRPATEYGYISRGKILTDGVFAVEKFVEKPDEATARSYLEDGYLWNSGNLMFRVRAFLDEYRSFDADSAAAVTTAVEGACSDLGFITLKANDFARSTAKSADYAVMEKTTHAGRAGLLPLVGCRVVAGSLGSRGQGPRRQRLPGHGGVRRLEELLRRLRQGGGEPVRGEDVVVVSSEDAVLVANRRNVDDMRQFVHRLKEVIPRITEGSCHRASAMGQLSLAHIGTRYQVKRILVKPGGRLSLQLHHHRAEHWVIVRGTDLDPPDRTMSSSPR